MCKFIDKNTVKITRMASELDKFVLDFVGVVEKHCKYVIVSGYVSILFGRSRVTEDIDMIISSMDRKAFEKLHADLIKKGFDVVNVDDLDELYGLLTTKHSIRYAYKGGVIPNMELKFAHDRLQKEILEANLKVIIGGKVLHVSPLELQIAFKEKILGSEKDKEDARHLEIMFKNNLDKEKLKVYRLMLK